MNENMISNEVREDEIDLMDLVKILVRRKITIIAVTAIISLVAILAGGWSYLNGKTANVIIGYNYDGVSKGLNPDGTRFNRRDIVDTVIIRRVYNKYPNLSKEGIRLKDLKGAVDITGITPNNISEIAEASLKKGENYIYNPSNFVIDFKLTGNGEQDKKILQDIIEEYLLYFQYKYRGNIVVPKMEEKKILNYDFEDELKIIQSNVERAKEIAKRREDKGFVSTETGMSYTDLSRMLSNISDIDIKNISSSLYVNEISKYPNEKKLLLEDKVRELKNKKAKIKERALILSSMLNQYKPSERKMILPTLGETGIKISTEEEYYTKLVKDYETAATKEKILGVDILEAQRRISEVNNNKAVIKSIEGKIQVVLDNFNNIAEVMTKMNKEYEDKYFANSVKIISPVSLINESKAKLIVAIGIVLGVLLGIASAFIAEFIEYYKRSNR